MKQLIKKLEDNIKEYGPDEIVVVKDDRLKDAADSEIASLMAELAKHRKPNSILFGAIVVGRSIAPRLQAKLNTGLTSDYSCIGDSANFLEGFLKVVQ
ncbi:MAG: hypothetical protein RR439_01475 [Carnobacterium sp.]